MTIEETTTCAAPAIEEVATPCAAACSAAEVETVVEVSVPEAEAEVTATAAAVSSDISAKILKQVEFYFSDANLPRDRFLQEELKKNDEGWIAVSVIASFKRMEALSKDLSVITESLKDSASVEVSEDCAFVRRRTALPEAPLDSFKTCVLVRQFEPETTLEQLEEFFSTVVTGGAEGIAAIRLRRNHQSKAFKGSVFLVLKSEEECARLIELKSFEREGKTYELVDMTTFMEEQNAKQLARAGKSCEKEEAVPETPLTVEDVKKMVLTVTGCPVDLDHRLLRTALSSKGPVAFVENATPEGFSVVRFREPVAADLIAQITAEGGIRMPGVEEPLMVREPTDEEVDTFFVKMQEFKAKAAVNGGGKNYSAHKRNFNNKNYKRVKRT